MPLEIAVRSFAESHQSMRPERLDDAADGFDGDGRFWFILRTACRDGEACEENHGVSQHASCITQMLYT